MHQTSSNGCNGIYEFDPQKPQESVEAGAGRVQTVWLLLQHLLSLGAYGACRLLLPLLLQYLRSLFLGILLLVMFSMSRLRSCLLGKLCGPLVSQTSLIIPFIPFPCSLTLVLLASLWHHQICSAGGGVPGHLVVPAISGPVR